jgi:hypothetical protein
VKNSRPALAAAILLGTPSLIELLLGDLRVSNTCQISACPGIADIRVNTPEGEGQGNQGKKDLDNSLVVANGVKEHGNSPLTYAEAKQKKANLRSPFGTGGVDGTRTRDPRRDRPVF